MVTGPQEILPLEETLKSQVSESEQVMATPLNWGFAFLSYESSQFLTESEMRPHLVFITGWTR